MLARPVSMGKRNAIEMHPYAVLGGLLAGEPDAGPPRLSRKRKRLRAGMRARLAVLAVERKPRGLAPQTTEDMAGV